MKKYVFLGGLTVAIVCGGLFYADYQENQKDQQSKDDVKAVVKMINDKQKEQKPEIGFQAPSFQLKGLDHKVYEVKGNRDKPIVINFWASWCGPCQEEAPALRDLHLKYKDKVDIYAVNVEGNGKLEPVESFVKAAKFQMPIPVDSKGEVADKYQIVGLPTTFFIDKQGVIRNKMLGAADMAMFEKNMKELLAK